MENPINLVLLGHYDFIKTRRFLKLGFYFNLQNYERHGRELFLLFWQQFEKDKIIVFIGLVMESKNLHYQLVSNDLIPVNVGTSNIANDDII